MQLVTVQFEYNNSNYFKRLLDVFVQSCIDILGSAPIVYKIPCPFNGYTRPGAWRYNNTDKLEVWNEHIQNATEDTVLIDCDMLIMQDFSEVWQQDFDVAITKRDEKKIRMRHLPNGIPYNGGVVFVRNTDSAKRFIQAWTDCNRYLFEDTRAHSGYLKKYAGMNQAALGYLLEERGGYDICKVIDVPCAKYNACAPEFWENSNAKIVHVKSDLRKEVFSRQPKKNVPKYKYVSIWKGIEQRVNPDTYKAELPIVKSDNGEKEGVRIQKEKARKHKSLLLQRRGVLNA